MEIKTKSVKENVALSIGLLTHQQVKNSKQLFGPSLFKKVMERHKMKVMFNDFLSQVNNEKKEI